MIFRTTYNPGILGGKDLTFRDPEIAKCTMEMAKYRTILSEKLTEE